MKCPICHSDLSPLDLVSRTEHVDLCIENGPSVLELDEHGRPTVRRNPAAGKQRKICPICDKTFQNVTTHFKTCAIKHDVPPHLMLEHWDTINKGAKNPKQFPCDLFDSFVAKCVQENRVGDQVDIARALSLSMGKKDPLEVSAQKTVPAQSSTPDGAPQQPVGAHGQLPSPEHPSSTASAAAARDAAQLIMQTAAQSSASNPSAAGKKTKAVAKSRLQLMDADTKRANVFLRVERELAVTRSKRYRDALSMANMVDDQEDNDCMIVPDVSIPSQQVDPADGGCDKLFFRARMKNCDSSELCSSASCENHELVLLLEEFKLYSGTSMHPLVKEAKEIEEAEVGGETSTSQ